MEERDYYEVLQLHPDAAPTMVARSYWYLAHKCRAEMDLDAFAEHRLEELNRAFEVLGSADSRAAYDFERAARVETACADAATKRVSIQVSFLSLPAWQGILSATACAVLAIVAISAGASAWVVLPLAVFGAEASLVTLPSHFASSYQARHHLGLHRWRRDLRVIERLDRNMTPFNQLPPTSPRE